MLTTFTKTLAESMRRDLQALDPTIVMAKSLGEPGVFVVGVDAAVSAALKTAAPGELKEPIQRVLGQRTDRIQARNTKSSEQWRDSIESASSEVPPDLRHAAFFEAEYAMVVLPQRITSREEYFKVRRPGRGVSLNRERRSAVWDVVGAYRASSSVNGAVDFGEAAALAAALLETRDTRPADHVLVDEGQDLNPTQWQFLRALVARVRTTSSSLRTPTSGSTASAWSSGVTASRSSAGRGDWRSTTGRRPRICTSLSASSKAGEYLDIEEEATTVEGYRSARSGPAPRLVATSSITEELEQAAEIVAAWLAAEVAPDTIGILVRDASQANQISRGLEERGVPVRVITNQAGLSKLPQVMTMHRAKGMEFSRVLIFGADDGLVPASYLLKNVGEIERADAMQRERSLFYVAATRARDELVVIWSGDRTPFIR